MNGILWVGALLLALGVVLLVAARFVPARGATSLPVLAAGPAAASEVTGPVTKIDRTLTWPGLIDPEAGALAPDERRHIIDGLALVGDAWCADVLATAYGEESEPLRENVIDAIGRCAGSVVPTLERALRSHRVAERYAAIDAASRRGEVDLLERGLRDTDGTVALAAAYGLVRAGRRDLVDAGLAQREDARANEIRRALPALV